MAFFGYSHQPGWNPTQGGNRFGQSPLPRSGPGGLPASVMQSRGSLGNVAAAGVLHPGSPGYNDLDAQVQAIFGRNTNLPPDNPFSDYLISIGYGDANPGAFPERGARRDLRSFGVNAVSDLLTGGGGEATPGGGQFDFGGGGGSVMAPGGGGAALPPRVSLGPLMGRLNNRPARVSQPARIAGAAAAPERIGQLDTSQFELPPGFTAPQDPTDPLFESYRQMLRRGPYSR
jgi:hypothetical protein